MPGEGTTRRRRIAGIGRIERPHRRAQVAEAQIGIEVGMRHLRGIDESGRLRCRFGLPVPHLAGETRRTLLEPEKDRIARRAHRGRRRRQPGQPVTAIAAIEERLQPPERQHPRVLPRPQGHQRRRISAQMRRPVDRAAGEGHRFRIPHVVPSPEPAARHPAYPGRNLAGNRTLPVSRRGLESARADRYMTRREVGAGRRLANPVRSGRKQP